MNKNNRKLTLYLIQEIFYILIILFLASIIIIRINEILNLNKTTEDSKDETTQTTTTKTYDFPEDTSIQEQNKIILYDEYLNYIRNR